jgi:hypothetical protein
MCGCREILIPFSSSPASAEDDPISRAIQILQDDASFHISEDRARGNFKNEIQGLFAGAIVAPAPLPGLSTVEGRLGQMG